MDPEILIQKLEESGNTPEIKLSVAVYLAGCIEVVRNRFGDWEKLHLANAVAALARNISTPSAGTAWLRLCIVNADKALVHPEQRNEAYVTRYARFDSLSADDLDEMVRSLIDEC